MNSQRTTQNLATDSTEHSSLDAEAQSRQLSKKRRNRELIFLGCAVVAGFVVLPIAIFVVGTLTLGPYAGGKTLSVFFAEYFRNLAQGAPRTWFIALAPYLAIWAIRLLFSPNRWRKSTLPDPNADAVAARPANQDSRREPFISS